MDQYRAVCQGFVNSIETHLPEWRKKLKIHLLLHLPDDMLMYGPTAAFNTERYKEEILCILILHSCISSDARVTIPLFVVGIFLEISNLLVETLLDALQSKKA